MIQALSNFKNLFSCFIPALNELTRLFQKIFCCGDTEPVKPLNSDRVKVIKPEETPSKLSVPDSIPKNIVSDRVNFSYKSEREIEPSSSDANIFCGVTKASPRKFNLESEKRKRAVDKIQKAKIWPAKERKNFEILEEKNREEQRERIASSHKRNKFLADLRKFREGSTEDEWRVQYEKREQRSKEIKGIHANIKLKMENAARNAPPSMSEVAYTLNGFIYLREKPEPRKEVSKESIEAGYKRFKEHQKTQVAADIDPEEKKKDISHAQSKVLSYIVNKRASSSANFVQIMQSIVGRPQLKVLTDDQVKTLEVKKRFLHDLKFTLSNKKPSDPLTTLRYFEAEFETIRLPVTNEKLREWRMKLNSLLDARFDPLKEEISKLITLQTAYNELPDYSINTCELILFNSQKLHQELKLRVKGFIEILQVF